MSYTRENPSPAYRELQKIYADIHSEGLPDREIGAASLFDGASLRPHMDDVRRLAAATNARTILDFGSGKGLQYEAERIELGDGRTIGRVADYWNVDEIACYDPGVARFASYPERTFDGLVSTDVLEHVPADDIVWTLREFFRLADRFVFANIAGYPARKTLPNGWNAHVTVMPVRWWREQVLEAAEGWRGERYLFTYETRTTGLRRRMRKILGRRLKAKATIARK